jgi:ATP/maltotriose-dependent transcriptional regulator MalT
MGTGCSSPQHLGREVLRTVSDKPPSGQIPGTGQGADADGVAGKICSTWNSLKGDPIYLVLDDFHHVSENRGIIDFLDKLIEGTNSGFHLILISRKSFPEQICRYRGRNIVAEIGDRDLRFSTDEIITLFTKHLGCDLSASDIDAADSFICGWIGGFNLFFQYIDRLTANEREAALRHCLETQYIPTLNSFFETEVLEQLPPDLKALLVELSSFDRVSSNTLSICGREDPSAALSELVGRLLFLEKIDESGDEYRIHPLLKTYLNSLLARLPEDHRDRLHVRAFDYFTSAGDSKSAFTHFIQTSRHDEAMDMFTGFAEALLENHEYEVLDKMLGYFSADEIESHPLLSYYEGIIRNLTMPFSSRKKLLSLIPYFKERNDIHRQMKIYSELLMNYFFYLEDESFVEELITETEEFLNGQGDIGQDGSYEILKVLLNLGKWWITPEKEAAYSLAMQAEETALKYHHEDTLLCSRLVLAKIYLSQGEF